MDVIELFCSNIGALLIELLLLKSVVEGEAAKVWIE